MARNETKETSTKTKNNSLAKFLSSFVDKDTLKKEFKANRSVLFVFVELFCFFAFSLFYKKAIWAGSLVMIVSAIFLTFEQTLGVFIFSYTFEALFYLPFKGKSCFIFIYVYATMFLVSLVRYVFDCIRQKRKFNYRVFFPFYVFLLYIAIPFNPYNPIDLIKYCVAFAVLYLVIVNKKQINSSRLLVFACMGLFASSFLSIFKDYTNNLDFVKVFTYHGLVKFEGLMVNPNWISVYCSVILALLFYNSVFKKKYFWCILSAIVFAIGYMTVSRGFALCCVIIFFLIMLLLLIKRNKKALFRLCITIGLMGIVALMCFPYTVAYLERLKILKISNLDFERIIDGSIFLGSAKSYSNLWLDGYPNDPGRYQLFIRYFNDWTSSIPNILFGIGVSATELGIEAHNSYISFLWRFGLVGAFLLSTSLIYILIKLFKDFKRYDANILAIVLIVIGIIETNLFNHIGLIMLTLLITSCGGEYESNDNYSCFQGGKLFRKVS